MEDSEVINFSALEKELQAALEADKKYRRENDAKFRAIHQNVGSYEEFRDIVLASHLKPLEKTDKAGQRKQPWNPLASEAGKPSAADCEPMEASEALPRTAVEFGRAWRRLGEGRAEDRYRLLLSVGGRGLGTEGAGLLGDFLRVLWGGLCERDAGAVLSLLEELSRSDRFALSLAFLSAAERDACARLMTRLHGMLGDGVPESAAGGEGGVGPDTDSAAGENDREKLKRLMVLYGVPMDSAGL